MWGARLSLWLLILLLLLTHNDTQHVSPWSATLSFLREVLTGPSDLTRDVPTRQMLPHYDFVVVGAGSAGSVVAARLSEVAQWTVLLVEAGQDELAFTDIPFMSAILSSTSYSWGYRAQPQKHACLGLRDRRSKWPKGRGMGGSSILNGMIYNRGHPRDYDNWAELGSPGWSYEEVLPYFLKSENAAGDFADSPYHGKGGPLDVQRVPHRTELAHTFLQSVQEFGYPLVDYNSPDVMGFSLFQVSMRGGTRCSTNKAFLRPARKRPNLHVIKFSRATRVLINPTSRRAYGLEFHRDGRFYRVHATREVVLSAGAINSPQLLMLSGVGPREQLEKLKIPVIHDSPGVGQNLQDHIAFGGLTFFINQSLAILGSDVTSLPSLLQYIRHRDGVLTNIGVGEALGFIRSHVATTPEDYPDLEIMFSATHLGSDSSGFAKRHVGITDELYDAVYAPTQGRHGWSIYPIIMQPESRGSVTITSKNPFTRPIMFSNYLEVEHDLDVLVEGIKFALQLSKTRAFQQYNSTLHDIPYPACKHVKFASDKYWKCATRQLTTTVHHQCCTAKMGPRSDPMAVVDPELRVYGVQGLRVVDASIMPIIPAAHTNAPVIMIGEKAADVIKKAHGEE